MTPKGYLTHQTTLTQAIRYTMLAAGVTGTVILAGCDDTTSRRFAEGSDHSIGDTIKGELTSTSSTNLKDGSRQARHWVCGGDEAGSLYQVDAPFPAQVSLYDTEGNWLGKATSNADSNASLLLSSSEDCFLVVVSGSDQDDYGPYKLEPQPTPEGTGLTADSSVAGAFTGKESRHAFTVEQASQVSLRLDGAGAARLSLSGEDASGQATRCGDSQQAMTAFLQPGEYQAVITPIGRNSTPASADCQATFASTGNGYRLSMELADLSSGERNGGPLRSGDQITGTLTDPGSANTYTLEITEPSQLAMLVSSAAFDAVLKLSGGQTNIEVDDTDGSTDPRLNTLLMPGTYRVQVSGYEGETGAYSIDVSSSPFEGDFRNSGELVAGESVHGVAEGNGSNLYTLTLEQAGDVTIGLYSSAFDTLLGLSGPGVSMTDDDGGGNTDSRINAVLGAGTYQIEVSSYAGSAAGPFRLQTSVSPYDGDILQGCEKDDSGTCHIEENTSIQEQLQNGGQAYEFVLEQPAQVVITMTSGVFDTLLRLEGNGVNISDDDGAGQTNSRISTMLEAGTYSLTADTYDGAGVYMLRLESTPVQQ